MRQQAAQQPPTAPTTPTPTPVFQIPGGPGTQPTTLAMPRTTRDLDALKSRRSELSNQLNSVDSRRSSLMSQLRKTEDPVATKGLQDRLALLDSRQLQLETDLAQTGQLLSSVSAGTLASTASPPVFGGLSSNQVMGLSVLSIIFVLCPLAIGLGRAIFKRSSNKSAVPPQALTQTAQRLEHLESAVDAIAIEIERISEGQRFVTKLLSGGDGAPVLRAGAPESVRAGK